MKHIKSQQELNEASENLNISDVSSSQSKIIPMENFENIIDTSTNRSLIWWTTLPMIEQVKLGFDYFKEVSFNLTIRDIVFIHEQEYKKK
jgi:hypothetical protein